MAHPEPIETDVLIVGAGPTGLALAIELGMRGIRATVVERNERAGVAPRAKTTNVRTRSHLRRWGIADDLAMEAPFGIDYPNNMIFVTSLAGHELARFPNAFNAAPDRDSRYPEHAQWIPQYRLEAVMLAKASALAGIDIRFNTTFCTAVQDDAGVDSKLRASDGAGIRVRSRYLVGADGARSAVRDLIRATMVGRHGLSRNYNIIFRSPALASAHRHGPAAIYWQIGPRGFSLIGPMDKDDVWFFMPRVADGVTLSDREASALIAETTGFDLPFEILSSDQWVASELLADRYRDGRILLAGDACHLHPPFGGYGMNMGVGDGVDLGWKIAATLGGWGGPQLLDSYEAERRPVHRFVIDEAVANHQLVAGDLSSIEEDSPAAEAIREGLGHTIRTTKGREFNTLGTVLGLSYDSSPIILDDAAPRRPHDGATYSPHAKAGNLAPHAWLPDGRSLYDLFGQDFTLLHSPSADEVDIRAAIADANAIDVPLAVVCPAGFDIVHDYEARLVLIRPDQHVAWRGDRWDNPLPVAVGRGCP